MVADVLAESRLRLARLKPETADDVRRLGEPVVGFSAQMRENNRVMQSFLSVHMYRHPRVMDVMGRAQRVVRELFGAYMADVALLPAEWQEEANTPGVLRARAVCDFLAGMTDGYAIEQHRKLFDLEPLFR
jgi:dGTPase